MTIDIDGDDLRTGLVGLVVALLVCFVQPLKYSSTVRLLVMQDLGSATDAYTASRSEERIAENLSTIFTHADRPLVGARRRGGS